MLRSIFLAAGIVLCILGAECLVLEKAVLAKEKSSPQNATSMFAPQPKSSGKEIQPADWAPWSLLSAGAVVILYSYSIPRRNG